MTENEKEKFRSGFWVGILTIFAFLIWLTWPLAYLIVMIVLNFIFYGRSGLW